MSSQKIENYWLEYADDELKVARLLFADGERRGFAYQAAIFHCHQAVEKMLKAKLIDTGLIPPRIHDLTALADKLAVDIPEPIDLALQELNPHYLYPRYPDMKFLPSFHFSYNQKNTKHILIITEQICRWLKKQFKI